MSRLGRHQATLALEVTFGIWGEGETCETSCGAHLSSLAPSLAERAWAQSPPGGDDGQQMFQTSRRLLGLRVQKKVKRQACHFLAEDLQLTPGRWFTDFPSHFRSEHSFCSLSLRCPDCLPFWLSASQPHEAL